MNKYKTATTWEEFKQLQEDGWALYHCAISTTYYEEDYPTAIFIKQMTKEEKLQKIIERAEKNGYKGHTIVVKGLGEMKEAITSWSDYSHIIFNHEFAKAYWGEPEWEKRRGWQYHLQQLAITPPEERINYLYKYLKAKDK